jgi:hypothetical protein
MTGTRIGVQGPIAELNREGTAVEYHVSSSGFMPHQQGVIAAHITGSNSSSLKVFPGVQTVSGNTAHTLQMPLVAGTAGAMFTVRSTSAHAHILTGSLETAGAQAFQNSPATGLTLAGQAVTLAAAVGASVILYSDGAHFVIIGGSGSITP